MLSVIIVDYNSIEATLKYIEHLNQKIICEKIHFIIVDNGNNFDKIECLSEQYKRLMRYNNSTIYEFTISSIPVVYIDSGSNLGYARGNNLGVSVSNTLFKDPYILISNNDIILQEITDFRDISYVFDSDRNIAVIGPKVIGLHGERQSPHKKISWFKALFLYYWGLVLGHNFQIGRDTLNSNKNEYVYRVMGSFMFVRKAAFLDVGMFDESTFMFFEESILSEKLEKKGYKTFYYNDMEIIHNHGSTVKKNSTIETSMKWAFDSCCYYYKNYRLVNPLIINLAKRNFDLYLLLYRIKRRIRNED